ncbi:hypothetical protein B0H10DRAFT_1806579, partial [Mycena sp. CBHHK59/15]
VYRCWILWSRDYRVIIISTIMLIASTISGYMVCGLYSSIPRDATVFDPRLTNWITTFYSIAVAQNISTTGLMAWRLWQGEKNSARYRMGSRGSLMPILRILVESAALYLFVEILLLSLYAVDYNAQYILLECVTPIVVGASKILSPFTAQRCPGIHIQRNHNPHQLTLSTAE